MIQLKFLKVFEIPVLDPEEMWTQKAIDEPEAVLEELRLLKVSDVSNSSTVTALLKNNKYNQEK
jgi:hypothetical protein